MRLIFFLLGIFAIGPVDAQDPIRSVGIATAICEKYYAPQFAYQYSVLGAKFKRIKYIEDAVDEKLAEISRDPKLTSAEKTKQRNDVIKTSSPLISDLRKDLPSDLEKLSDSLFIKIKDGPGDGIEQRLSTALLGIMKSKTFVIALEDSKSGQWKSQTGAEMELRMSSCYPNSK